MGGSYLAFIKYSGAAQTAFDVVRFNFQQRKGGDPMSKAKDTKKETKKEPAKTPKEKKEAKKQKKAGL